MVRSRAVVHHCYRIVVKGIPTAGADSSLPDSLVLIRENKVGIDTVKLAESGAVRTSAERVVEREHSRHELVHADVVLRAGVIHREVKLLTADNVNVYQPVGELPGGLDAVGEAGVYLRLHDKPVYHDLDVVLYVLRELYILVEVVHISVDADADKSLLAQRIEVFRVLALASSRDRREHLYLCPFSELLYTVDYLIDRLAAYLPAAYGTVRHADTRV